MKKLNAIFKSHHPIDPPPIWLMRQAGRYLPEYRQIRNEAGEFLNLCYDSERASQVSLQPIERYGFDGAIIFADILLICEALGQNLWFVEGEGPRLTPLKSADGLCLDNMIAHLAPIGETIRLARARLPKSTSLIGFAGAPWTVASYMIAGSGTPDQAPAHRLKVKDEAAFQGLIDILVAATIDYLTMQVLAGAEILQIFESWAGSLTGRDFAKWAIEPMAAIVAGLRARDIDVPIIGFPRAAHGNYIDYARETHVQAVGLDTHADIVHLAENMPQDIVLQGNLDPQLLCQGGDAMLAAAAHILEVFHTRRFIFNLGHGVLPQTPPENVAILVDFIRNRVVSRP